MDSESIRYIQTISNAVLCVHRVLITSIFVLFHTIKQIKLLTVYGTMVSTYIQYYIYICSKVTTIVITYKIFKKRNGKKVHNMF